MPQHIDVPGMGIVEFPDGMNDDQIVAAIKQNMAPTAPPPQAAPEVPVTGAGMLKAADAGLAKTIAGMAGAPRTLATLGGQGNQAGVNAGNSYFGRPEDTRDLSKPGMIPLPTSEKALKRNQAGPLRGAALYQPQNPPGRQ